VGEEDLGEVEEGDTTGVTAPRIKAGDTVVREGGEVVVECVAVHHEAVVVVVVVVVVAAAVAVAALGGTGRTV